MTLVDSLQAALAGEHAAVYGYGVIGARLAGTSSAVRARSGYDTHRARRSSLRTAIAGAGAEPVAAEAAYDLGGPVLTPAQAKALAARIELAAAATYADVVAASDGAARGIPASWLSDAAVRAAVWSGTAAVFPGLPERSR